MEYIVMDLEWNQNPYGKSHQHSDLPFEIISESPSNAVTCLKPFHGGAKKIVQILKDEYNIWVCPNGGEMEDTVFRIGHIGYISLEDNQKLILALHDMYYRKLL